MTILDRIKYIVAQNGISISNIEKDLGFGNKTIYRWDKADPSISKVIAVAKYLNVDFEWLATGKERLDYLEEQTTYKNFLKKYNELSDENKSKISIFLEIAT